MIEEGLELTGLDGTNPLGFLAALGVLRVADEPVAGPRPRMQWNPRTLRPVLTVDVSADELVERLWGRLGRERGKGADKAERRRKVFEEARTVVRKKEEAIKRRRLSRDDARAARETELAPLRQKLRDAWAAWRDLLRDSSPDPVVSLGANLSASEREFRAFCQDAAARAEPSDRAWADFCAAFGSDHGTDDGSRRMAATPLALVSGSGHQDFLGSVTELMVRCTREHIREAILGPWRYADERFSLRWDPAEDRRYALMAEDPTASGNKPQTVWGANRLAFEGLAFLPCVPTATGIETVGVVRERDAVFLQWPHWSGALALDAVRALLGLRDLRRTDAESVRRCRARGVLALYRSQRIRVGAGANVKFNFTPGVPVWS